jgi:hypothetical protein
VDSGMSGLHQSGTEEGACLHSHGFQGTSLPKKLACRALGKRLMSGPISAKPRLMPGIVESRLSLLLIGSQSLGDLCAHALDGFVKSRASISASCSAIRKRWYDLSWPWSACASRSRLERMRPRASSARIGRISLSSQQGVEHVTCRSAHHRASGQSQLDVGILQRLLEPVDQA